MKIKDKLFDSTIEIKYWKQTHKKRMGCLPPSAFFYVIELDASTTIRVEKM